MACYELVFPILTIFSDFLMMKPNQISHFSVELIFNFEKPGKFKFSQLRLFHVLHKLATISGR